MNGEDSRSAPRPGGDDTLTRRPPDPHWTTHLRIRQAAPADAPAIVRLVDDNLVAGHLLPRSREDVERHAGRFVVLANHQTVVACAELAPLSRAVAEVRSLVVDAGWRGLGLGTRLIESLRRQARLAGFSTLCALTHDPSHFVRLGFSIVPHVWFPEKIATDCERCPLFRTCGQHAVALALDAARLDRPGTSHRRLPVAAAPAHGVGTGPRAERRTAPHAATAPGEAARR